MPDNALDDACLMEMAPKRVDHFDSLPGEKLQTILCHSKSLYHNTIKVLTLVEIEFGIKSARHAADPVFSFNLYHLQISLLSMDDPALLDATLLCLAFAVNAHLHHLHYRNTSFPYFGHVH